VRTDAPAVDVQWFAVGVARYTFFPLVLCMWALAITAATSQVLLTRYVSVALVALLVLNGATRFYSESMAPEINALPDGSWFVQAAPGGPWHTTLQPH
jgi:hypothetical protein